MAERACHGFGSTTQVGLTQALGAPVSLSTLSAEQIAEHQLLAAITLWREEDYLSSLTLAGAAEEVLGKRLRKLGREPSLNQWRGIIVDSASSDRKRVVKGERDAR